MGYTAQARTNGTGYAIGAGGIDYQSLRYSSDIYETQAKAPCIQWKIIPDKNGAVEYILGDVLGSKRFCTIDILVRKALEDGATLKTKCSVYSFGKQNKKLQVLGYSGKAIQTKREYTLIKGKIGIVKKAGSDNQ